MPKKAEEEGKVSDELLKKYEEDKLFLVSVGLDIGDLGQARNVFQNLKKIKFDTKLAISILKGFQDLQSKIALLEVEENEESAKLEALRKGVKAVDQELHEKEALVEQARALRDSGLSVEMVGAIRKAVAEIAAKRNLRPDEALERFRKEVLQDYDPLLGLQPKIDAAKQEIEKTKGELKSEQDRLDEARRALGSLGAVVKSYTSLQDRGVKDDVIISLDASITQTGLTPKEVELELLKYRSLSQSIGGLEREMAEARRKLDALHSSFESEKKETERQLALKHEEIKRAEADCREAVGRVAEAGGLTADFDSVKAGLDRMKGDSTSLELLIGQKKVELDGIVERVAEAAKVEADLEVVRRERDRQKAELEFYTRDDERFETEWQEKIRKYQEKLSSIQVERAKLIASFESLKELVGKEMKSTQFLLCFDRLADEKAMGQLAPDATVLSMQTATEGFSKYLALHRDDPWNSPELAELSSKFASELASTYPKVTSK
ncbi:MAG TPA: hypothetical protein VMS77_07660 [Conexivisphaerales archaeon]|nr:hypothetical protein [Conexivisphaerales archaeon]